MKASGRGETCLCQLRDDAGFQCFMRFSCGLTATQQTKTNQRQPGARDKVPRLGNCANPDVALQRAFDEPLSASWARSCAMVVAVNDVPKTMDALDYPPSSTRTKLVHFR
jgi:hypothetical protein